jgi:hypothetical protein
MLRTICALLVAYLDKSSAEITIDSVNDTRDRFRPFLENRKYAANSIRGNEDRVRGFTPSRKATSNLRFPGCRSRARKHGGGMRSGCHGIPL